MELRAPYHVTIELRLAVYLREGRRELVQEVVGYGRMRHSFRHVAGELHALFFEPRAAAGGRDTAPVVVEVVLGGSVLSNRSLGLVARSLHANHFAIL